MSDPAIQYARSADGIDIAYSALGEGMTFLCLPPVPFSNLQTEWVIPEARSWYERMAQDVRVVRFDGRGTGLSDRSATNFTLDTMLADLKAVDAVIGDQPTVIWATFAAGPVAIHFAASRPERVSHLVLWGATAHMSHQIEHPRTAGLLSLVERDWELFTNSAAHQWMGWGSGESALRAAEHFRSCATPEVAAAYLQLSAETDVSEDLPHVAAPTLVLHRRDVQEIQIEHSRVVAAGIPGAQLRLVPGDSPSPFTQEAEDIADIVLEFIGAPSPSAHARPSPGEAAAPADGFSLTDREREVLGLLAAGLSNRAIAEQLVVEVSTVKTHVSNVLAKLGAESRGHAIALAHERGLVPER